MKIQFAIDAVLVLKNGKITISGVAFGQRLTSGKSGCASTKFGELEVRVVSVGLIDPPPKNPNAQMLLVEVPNGDPKWLEGATVLFE